MDNVLNFLADNYIWFMVGGVVLLIALIGFIVDGKKKKKEEDSNLTNNNITDANAQVPVQDTNINQNMGINNDLNQVNGLGGNVENVTSANVEAPSLAFDTPINEVNNDVNTMGNDSVIDLGNNNVSMEPITFEAPSQMPTIENVTEESVQIEPVVSAVNAFEEVPSEPVSAQMPQMNVPETPVMQTPVAEMPVNNVVNEAPVFEPVQMDTMAGSQVSEVPTAPIEIPVQDSNSDNSAAPLV